MGIIIAKFRKNKSTLEILEKLQNEITHIEAFGKSTEESKKKIMRRFIFLTITIAILMLSILYFYYNKISYNGKWICLTAFFVSPFILFFIKRILMWYYNRKIDKNRNRLIALKENKKKILDNVMETETYKVAKNILDKFGISDTQEPESNKRLTVFKGTLPTSNQLISTPTGIRRRIASTSAVKHLSTNRVAPLSSLSNTHQNRAVSGHNLNLTPSTRSVPVALPGEVLLQHRSILDKVVDYLTDNGPSNKYALICQTCNGHNGLATKDEFEYLSFKCYFCSHFNPSRKKRPTAPAIEIASPTVTSADSSASESESSSESIEQSIQPKGRDSPVIEMMSIDSLESPIGIYSSEELSRNGEEENVASPPEPMGAAGDGNAPDTTVLNDNPSQEDTS